EVCTTVAAMSEYARYDFFARWGVVASEHARRYVRAKRERFQMSEIHGLGVHAAGAQLLPYKYDPGVLRADEVEIKISHCGVCFSDVHLIDNDWGMSKYPFI